MDTDKRLALILQEGESQYIEFKEAVNKHLDREIIAFANTAGGSIFIGVNDDNEIIGTQITNSIRSQIQDIAHNCDPSLRVDIITYQQHSILEVKVEEGADKPYKCKDGFYIRQGDCTQKLKRDEIIDFISSVANIRFDEALNKRFRYPEDFSKKRLTDFLKKSGINTRETTEDILVSLNLAAEKKGAVELTNAGVLFFAEKPQKFFQEGFITAIKYQSTDKFKIIDKKEISGSLIEQIDDAMTFVMKHVDMEIKIKDQPGPELGRRIELYDYPIPALRESIINAITHRDYAYDMSHIYIHMYSDRIEIENPGGLCRGMTAEMLTSRSIRRNSLIADLLHRAGYIERVGSGFTKIESALKENNNPPYEISTTNFFSLRFHKRLPIQSIVNLTARQRILLNFIRERGSVNSQTIAQTLNTSVDTALSELRVLITLGFVRKEGKGKSTQYCIYIDRDSKISGNTR